MRYITSDVYFSTVDWWYEVLLQISDTGIGIPAAEQAKIFDEFYRAGKATEIEENSPGLGLVIVHGVV